MYAAVLLNSLPSCTKGPRAQPALRRAVSFEKENGAGWFIHHMKRANDPSCQVKGRARKT